MPDILAIAEKAARAAGRFQRENLWKEHSITFKKGENDLVTEVDRASEEMIVGMIREEFPDHDILAEENDYGARGSEWRWIIDPLDGTTNYAHGFPWFAVSIGIERAGRMEAAVVCHPMMDELFTARRGGGAFVNGTPIGVSRRSPLRLSLLATGFPYDRTDGEDNFANFIRFQTSARAVRRPGAAALDLAYVACGRLDGFWEAKLNPWDTAAGKLLVAEAGGRVTNYDGEEHGITEHRIVASNGLIHDEMLALLAREG